MPENAFKLEWSYIVFAFHGFTIVKYHKLQYLTIINTNTDIYVGNLKKN